MRRYAHFSMAVVFLTAAGPAALGAQEPVSSGPARGAAAPPAQRRFLAAIRDWCPHLLEPTPDNPIAAEQARRTSLQQLRLITGRVGPIQSWSGVLVAISPYQRFVVTRGEDASGATLTLAVDTIAEARVTQYGDHIPPTAYVSAEVGSSSALYAAAGRMSVGQRVLFSGRMLQTTLRDTDMLWRPYEGQSGGLMRNSGEPAGCGVPFAMRLTALRSAP